MPVTNSTQDLLDAVLASTKLKIIGTDLLKNDAEARLLMAVTRAYGADGCGFIYVSPSRARSTRRPPDVVLCHPMIGLLLIEAKGHGISDIEGIEAGHMIVRYENRPIDIKDQVEDQLYEISRDLTKLGAKPLTNWMVAFPNISQDEWRERGYDKAFPCNQLLFREQIDDPARLEKRVRSLVLESLSRSRKTQILPDEHTIAIQRVFGNSALINECREVRPQIEKQKLGAQIDAFVTQDKYLSEEQRQLIRMNIGGAPRVIRGVAGSGKSIVLAELVARYLHHQLPLFDSLALSEADTAVAVTCFNRTLVEFLRRKIQGAYHVQTLSEDIPRSVLLITHLNELMWILCKQRGWPLKFVPVSEIQDATRRATVYREQIATFVQRDPDQYHSLCFDALFVDEGQDFEPEEYRLLLDLIKPHPKTGEKTLIIFYDDAQNLFGKPRPVWREVGINIVGERSKIMRRCYRNSRQVVELAFNVLLGTQASTRATTRTYADIAYLKDQGMVEEHEDYIQVYFAEREGPPPAVKSFKGYDAEIEWVAGEVIRLIKEEEVRPEDILVLFDRPGQVNLHLLRKRITEDIPSQQFVEPYGKNDKNGYILQPNYLTLSTVYGAKGYDAPIVFVIGADRFPDDTTGRAMFYVAATRAKLFLYITGVVGKRSLLTEAEMVSKRMCAELPTE